MSLVKKNSLFCCWDLLDFYLRGQERKNEGGLQAQAESAAPFKMGYRIQDTPEILYSLWKTPDLNKTQRMKIHGDS